MKEKKRIEPFIPKQLEPLSLYLEDESTVEGASVDSQAIEAADFHHLFFKESHFKKLIMPSSSLRQFECVNIVFENCDFSNCEWIGGSFHQVEFRQCRLTGSNFAESYMKDCLFRDCLMDYASFAASTAKIVEFQECSIKHSDFSEVEWDTLRFTHCELTQSQWFHTKLKALDLSENTFDSIALSPETLQGVVVNQEQALTIAETLGIRIK